VATAAERAILGLLSKMLLQTGGIVNEHMSERNSIRRMVTAGSKGSFINLSQICAALGQQSLEGSRIVAEKGHRTLPCFALNDTSLASHGMVQNSFALGLTPPELFFHGIGGREGLVDTAVKTSQTGYLQRRMNKSMEDNTVCTDGTVRNAKEEIISFRWGSDGMHPCRLERVKLSILSQTPESIRARMTHDEANVAIESRAQILRTKQHVLCTSSDTRVLVPFNPERIRRRLQRLASNAPADAVFIDPNEASAKVLEMAENMPHATKVALLDVLCASQVCGVPKESYDEIVSALTLKIAHACSVTGESVGCLAAQSVGEPATQMTLNTFHTAGVSAKNVTIGIPRFKELLDASKSQKTPCTTLRLKKAFTHSPVFAEYVAETVPLTRLGDVVVKTDIVLDADFADTTVAEDKEMVVIDRHFGRGKDVSKYSHFSKYVVRLQLHQDTMRARQLTPPMIRRMLCDRLRDRAHVVASEATAIEWCVRVRFGYVTEMSKKGDLGSDQEAIISHRAIDNLMRTMVLGGHVDVTSTTLTETPSAEVKEPIVHAYGNFLLDCASLQCVDWVRCTSNDVWEVLNTLGIEACVHVLFDQIKTVVSFDGTYVDDRHIQMIVDSMCRCGTLMPLNRHGINRTDSSPLMRCSFEETVDVLCDAAMFSEQENARGVTTAIMTGQLANFGTGTVQVRVPDHNTVSNKRQLYPQGRVMRSTCRSFVQSTDETTEQLEYVLSSSRPSRVRALSPPTLEGVHKRKRARFRPASP